MAIVGFGFQVKNDLASTGDPHISSFTVAVRQKDTEHDLCTVCEVPFMKGSRVLHTQVKTAFLTSLHSIPTHVITQKLAEKPQPAKKKGDEDWIQIHDKMGTRAWAKHLKSAKQVLVKWQTTQHIAETGDPVPDVTVYYHQDFVNVQAIAHPYLFPFTMAVHGDYRVSAGYNSPKNTRFTNKLFVRFPVGTLRGAYDKHPSECDTLAFMQTLQRQADDAWKVIVRDIRRLLDPLKIAALPIPPVAGAFSPKSGSERADKLARFSMNVMVCVLSIFPRFIAKTNVCMYRAGYHSAASSSKRQ